MTPSTDAGSSLKSWIETNELDSNIRYSAASWSRKHSSNSSARSLAATASLWRGRVQVPDVRIEYETAGGMTGRVSLELTTDHYKQAQIAAKASAGFTLYSLGGDSSSGGSFVRDEREITAGILSI